MVIIKVMVIHTEKIIMDSIPMGNMVILIKIMAIITLDFRLYKQTFKIQDK